MAYDQIASAIRHVKTLRNQVATFQSAPPLFSAPPSSRPPLHHSNLTSSKASSVYQTSGLRNTYPSRCRAPIATDLRPYLHIARIRHSPTLAGQQVGTRASAKQKKKAGTASAQVALRRAQSKTTATSGRAQPRGLEGQDPRRRDLEAQIPYESPRTIGTAESELLELPLTL